MRKLEWGQVANIRDLGGLPTLHGPTQFGRIARSPRRELMDDGAWNAATTWGLHTIIDLRCSYEIGRHDDDPVLTTAPQLTVVHAPTEDHDNAEFRETCFPILDSPACWSHNIRILPNLVRSALEAIAEATPGILVHCSAGRDRTGLVTALLLANAGVAPHLIADDYELPSGPWPAPPVISRPTTGRPGGRRNSSTPGRPRRTRLSPSSPWMSQNTSPPCGCLKPRKHACAAFWSTRPDPPPAGPANAHICRGSSCGQGCPSRACRGLPPGGSLRLLL